MKLLVTGDKGYLGSRFVSENKAQFDIIGYDLVDGYDIHDTEALTKAMHGVDVVVHLAAIPKPVVGKGLRDYIHTNVVGTENVLRAAYAHNVARVIYASSTTVYGIERGIPFRKPITENVALLSQYMQASDLSCRECDLSYHVSKVMAEQLVAWYGLQKKMETLSLRFGPIGKVFLDTSVSDRNAVHALERALMAEGPFWYEAFSIVDDIPHIDTAKAKKMLGYAPVPPQYTAAQRH